MSNAPSQHAIRLRIRPALLTTLTGAVWRCLETTCLPTNRSLITVASWSLYRINECLFT